MKERITKLSSTALTTGVLFMSSMGSLFAAGTSASEWINNLDAAADKDLKSWVTDTVNFAIGLAALAAVVMLIAAGFMYITANGDEQKIGKATKTLTFAIVGLVVCFIAVMIVNFVLGDILGK